MADLPDPITQSLERATDDLAFESLCSDVLAGSGYPGIEPIGGTGDGGRDALHVDRSKGTTTICAFSLRKDWFKVNRKGEASGKLIADCQRIRDLAHECQVVLFGTSCLPTPKERDNAIAAVRDQFGWDLEIYGRQRIATQIRSHMDHLIEHYKSIFLPGQFRLAGGRLLESSAKNLLIVDYVDPDRGFAHWVAQFLRRQGYDVWSLALDSAAGESVDETLRSLLRIRAQHHLPVFSATSVASPEFRGRVESSASDDLRLLPLLFDAADLSQFSPAVRRIHPIDFIMGRAKGIHELIKKLAERDTPISVEVSRGRKATFHLPPPRDLVSHEPETLISNVYPITRIPTSLRAWRLPDKIKKLQIENARRVWPFVRVGDTAYSFTQAPETDELGFSVTERTWTLDWQTAGKDSFDGDKPSFIVSELLRRTLDFAFYKAGLLWCPEQELIYFDPSVHLNETTGKGKKLKASLPTGQKAERAVCGQKSRFRAGQDNEPYSWQFAPCYKCHGQIGRGWEFRLWVRLRVAFRDGTPIPSKRIVTFRRDAAKGWMSDRFRDLIAVAIHHAASGESSLSVGDFEDRVEVMTTPLTFESPVGLDEAAIPAGAKPASARKNPKHNDAVETVSTKKESDG